MAVSRQSQIDAVELDSECYQLFQTQLNQSFTHLPINILKRIEPEISALLNLAVYVVPLYTTSRLVSHKLLGIEYSEKTASPLLQNKWYAYSFAIVGMKWISLRWSTLSPHILNESMMQPLLNTTHAAQFLSWLHLSAKIANLLNSLVFLKQGLYPTVLHRVLNLRTKLTDPNQPRSTDLSTLTRELLWHSFAETLMFVLPLVNVHRVKSWFSRVVRLRDDTQANMEVGKNSLCAVCNEVPIIPQEAECHHTFCYYCLTANLEAIPEYTCPLCSCFIGKGQKDV